VESGFPCNLCGSLQRRLLYDVPDYTFHPDETFPVVRCLDCGFIFVNRRPSLEEMGRYYPKDYYHEWEDEACVFLRPNRVKLIQQVRSQGSILDIGCHRGEFLAQMRERGWEVWGSEWSQRCCDYARKTFGLEHIFEGDFLSHRLPADSFDVVTLWHVLEHLFDPHKALVEVRRLLKRDGLLIVECPNFDSLARRLFGVKWHQFEAPRHLYHFTSRTLGRLMGRAGFSVIKTRGNTNLFGDLVDLRVGFMRSVGLYRLRAQWRGDVQEGAMSSPNLLWRIARSCFSSFCFMGALFAVFLGQGSNLYVVCQKKGEPSNG